jgi:hypothetical protein
MSNVIDIVTRAPFGSVRPTYEYDQALDLRRRTPGDRIEINTIVGRELGFALLPIARALQSEAVESLRSREDAIEIRTRTKVKGARAEVATLVDLRPDPEHGQAAWSLVAVLPRACADKFVGQMRARGMTPRDGAVI